jgi:hypothetical protein
MTIPTKFKNNPVLDISKTFNRLVPKTMAFGGVAAGNIKAKEAAIVAGSINNNGLTSKLIANPAITGRKVSTVAVFEVTSVKKVIKEAITKIIIIG